WTRECKRCRFSKPRLRPQRPSVRLVATLTTAKKSRSWSSWRMGNLFPTRPMERPSRENLLSRDCPFLSDRPFEYWLTNTITENVKIFPDVWAAPDYQGWVQQNVSLFQY